MELNMKENGLKINNTDTELKPGQMVLNMMDNMRWVKNMEKENSIGQIPLCIQETSLIIISMVKQIII
jgi:hypothetical protein